MLKNWLYIVLVFFVAGNTLVAQSDRKLRLQAEDAFANKDWYSAAQYYYRMFNRDSSSLELKYKYAEASRLNFDFDVALRIYNKIS